MAGRGRKRAKAAFFSFTSCEGCQLMVLSCERELPELVDMVDIVDFREAKSSRSDDYDIAFVEGSITRAREAERLEEIRRNAEVVVALGACSSTGGLNLLKNRFSMDEVRRMVYGDKAHLFDTMEARPIEDFIDVDVRLHGCPISKKEFLGAVKDLLLGKVPAQTGHPVCAECKKAGNVCVFELGRSCMGPVTRAGCDAVCVSYGTWCWGCRGPVDDANGSAHMETLARHGLTVEEALRLFDLYGRPESRDVKDGER
ncbi:MAG TPA: NADH:ubiquinone oxidoreductase [Deltaproteobacteria bacterium]|nr:NADH:ubiquinone oxidoreductase [Deltaproteobacteria bacterium]